MLILFQAVVNVLNNAATGAAPPPTPLAAIRLESLADIENTDRPLITVGRQGGGSPLPIAGWDEPFVVLKVWSRKSPEEAIQIYEWVSSLLNQRHRDITTQMLTIGQGGKCDMFVRQWRAEPLWEDLTRDWYVTARYYAKAFDFADLHSAYGF